MTQVSAFGSPIDSRRGRPLRTLAVLAFAVTAALTAVGAHPAAAAPSTTPDPSKPVIFLGDSVTAGFGYLGQQEVAANVSGRVNQEFANSWYFGDNSLSDCNPPEKGTPDDRCSNNNFKGAPWSAGSWQAGANAPDVAYSYQIAARQNPQAAAQVQNWAVTGSTPAMWAPGSGEFGFQTRSIRDQYVVMTLGANPILASFLKIRVSGKTAADGACADSTMWLGWTGWWAYPTSNVVKCADQQWAQNKQTESLVAIYKTLLQNNNKVLAMGYYRACPWSFGVWQPNGNVAKGPAAGNACPSQTEKVSQCSSCKVDGTTSQWEQAVAASNAMNNKIEAAVASVQEWAKSAPGVSPSDLQYVLPDQSEWGKHQAWHDDPWIFKNDTWIHPSKAGHKQLANTVVGAMCRSFGQWCGTAPTWDLTPAVRDATVAQSVAGTVPRRIAVRSARNLPDNTDQGNPLDWNSRTPQVCQIFHGDLVTRRDSGTCRLTAFAARNGEFRSLTDEATVRVG